MVVAATCLAALPAGADGGSIGYVFASEGSVVVERGCELWVVREPSLLRLSDIVRTAPGSRARIRSPGFGHLDLEPETSIQADRFYRSPNESALKSLLELLVLSGGFRFVAEGRDALEMRLAFRDHVLSMRAASVLVEKQNDDAGVSLLEGEISIESRTAIIRYRAPAFIGTFDYRLQRTTCAETS